MKKRLLAALLASAMAASMLLTGCSSTEGGATASDEKVYRVGFVNIDNAD